MKNLIVAIDGPAGSGKSTIAKLLAKKYNLTYIDTGAMYRMITLYLLENNIDISDLKEVERVLNTVNLDMQGDKFYLDNVDVSTKIREKRINDNVSKVASIKIVRSNLVDLQRKISNNKDVILDGRDVGTVIFPNAQVKIFLIASPEERARRRYNEFLEKKTEITYDEVLKSIKERDHIDSTRDESPFVKADDAIELDSTNLTIEDVINFISKEIEKAK
ncbi:(d)CMP kinase [Fusobacterium periodonticum]|uniref:Cytidylate kinase n=1 Tax=Fusobacterium periodonticum 1_1_41FAA TaxID=469621 RepID=D6LJ07_9FUSO|nr:(d)CMP kinase [Fusobacterium periodonticum]EFG28383.1 cytidylate kinase [Fusobacterium periodonticum 1_1_41FAA]MBF1202914.1 (d)CMP kinase [Fusobacterium periodonticum]